MSPLLLLPSSAFFILACLVVREGRRGSGGEGGGEVRSIALKNMPHLLMNARQRHALMNARQRHALRYARHIPSLVKVLEKASWGVPQVDERKRFYDLTRTLDCHPH